ncbi:hypothetical protein N7519_004819, partial [Penicillium mononematosum]|uniref:uncharacterized protein n=1 Tax=Penicillium mononematosum TaxID=268346 RepID=UPI002547E289
SKDRSGPPISSHGLVVKRMTSNHEILGSTPSVSNFFVSISTTLDTDWLAIRLYICNQAVRVSTRTSSHGLVVKRMTCNHEIRGSTPRAAPNHL